MKWRLTVSAVAILLMVNLLIPEVAIASAPAVPTQASPANGATDLPPQVTVRWTLSISGETYRVQISKNSTFTSLVTDAQVQDATGWTVFGLSKGTTYYWRVNASANGQTSPWSPVWSFTVTNKAIPAVPVLVSPANGATGLPDDPTLVWNAVEGADSYDIQLGTKPTFSSWQRTKWSYVGTSIRVFADLEDYSHTFYWRVRAKNAAGVSAWSAPWQFTCATFGCD
ncbi:MAG: DUF4962 domain-containing protein [Chloroflexi bacterium]|nr:DUF4962 domain-containing protein [Chloroflexota bacterium]